MGNTNEGVTRPLLRAAHRLTSDPSSTVNFGQLTEDDQLTMTCRQTDDPSHIVRKKPFDQIYP